MSTVTAGPGGSIVSCRPGPSSSSLPPSPSGTKTVFRNGSSKDSLFGTALRFLKLTRRVLYRSYVPIKVDYSDVYDVMAFFVGMPNGQGSHDSLAQKIGEAGRQWAKDYWRYADMACVGEAHLLLGPTPCFNMSSGNADFGLSCGLQRLHVPPLPRVCSHPPPRRRRRRLCRDAVFQLVISRNPFTWICIVPFIFIACIAYRCFFLCQSLSQRYTLPRPSYDPDRASKAIRNRTRGSCPERQTFAEFPLVHDGLRAAKISRRRRLDFACTATALALGIAWIDFAHGSARRFRHLFWGRRLAVPLRRLGGTQDGACQ